MLVEPGVLPVGKTHLREIRIPVNSSFFPQKMNRHGITPKSELTPNYQTRKGELTPNYQTRKGELTPNYQMN